MTYNIGDEFEGADVFHKDYLATIVGAHKNQYIVKWTHLGIHTQTHHATKSNIDGWIMEGYVRPLSALTLEDCM